MTRHFQSLIMCSMIVLAVAALAVADRAGAQDWPTRPVSMIVPYAAGGPVDVLGRIMAQRLDEILGRPVVVENVSGAGGMTGTNRVAKAAPDGYQFVLGGIGTFAFIPSLFKRPLYDPVADFAPAGLIVEQPLVLITRKDFPATTLREFAIYGKLNAPKMQFGSGGAGSALHLGCVLLNAAIGIDVSHIPYRGSAFAISDLVAGRLDYLCETISTALPHIESGTVKALATLTRERSSRLPGLATAHEQGVADFDAYVWNAFFFPKNTPDRIVQRLHKATGETLDTPSVQKRLGELGVNPVPPERRSTAYLARFLPTEIAKWIAPIKASGATLD